MIGSRREFLIASGAAVTTGFTGVSAANPDRISGRLTVGEGASGMESITEAFRQAYPDVTVSTTNADGFGSFLDGTTDVHHAGRPMAAGERDRAAGNGIDPASVQTPLEGAALDRADEGWCNCLSETRHDALRSDAARVETWSEITDADADAAPESTALPEAETTVLVRGTRDHQYAIGHGGEGYYEVAPSTLRPLGDAGDGARPLVRLGFSYADRRALTREAVAAFVRFHDALATDVDHFSAPNPAPTDN